MLLIFSSKLIGKNHAIETIAEKLMQDGIRCGIINPHDFLNNNHSLSQVGDKISFRINDEEITPSAIYMSNAWRCDAIINIPKVIKFPNAYRMRINQYVQDIRFAFEDVVWIPGKYEAVERAESKPLLMKLARLSGLDTPLYTCNSGSNGILGTLPKKI